MSTPTSSGQAKPEPTVPNLHRIGHRRLPAPVDPLTGGQVVAPAMPWARHRGRFKRALAERATHVEAGIREPVITGSGVKHGDEISVRLDTGRPATGQRALRGEPYPLPGHVYLSLTGSPGKRSAARAA